MPDWSYRTVLRPLLFVLPAETARRIALGTLGALARLPGGPKAIDLLGHMRADERLATQLGSVPIAGPVGFAALLDPEARAYRALSRFGVGFIEVGPVAATAREAEPRWDRDLLARRLSGSHEAVYSANAVAERLAQAGSSTAVVPVCVRIAPDERDPSASIAALAPWARTFCLELPDETSVEDCRARMHAAMAALRANGAAGQLLISVRADQSQAAEWTACALQCGAIGVWVRAELRADDAAIHGEAALEAVCARVRALRAQFPSTACAIVAGGVLCPADVQRLREKGASLACVDAGLIFSGPGLIKRCNQTLLAADGSAIEPEPFGLAAARSAWFWAFLLGVAMAFGGALAALIASTRVVLPYDEQLCGLSRAQLAGINPRLLPFMSHDRMTLAGTMVSVGVLYGNLAWNGMRRGEHWAHVAVVSSGLSGFANMFAFLGFGYFDPFHSFVTAVLFQFLLLSMVTPLGRPCPIGLPEWREDASWRRGQWGQLLFVVMGIGLIGAGAVITYVGCTDVLVREDLEFMRTNLASLAFHERLMPLVAHDRASMGGMLIANGVAVALSTLWGFRRGAAWLWWALAWAGGLAFAAAMGVHLAVGYNSMVHLAPAFLGGALWCLGLALTRGWLTARG